MDRKIYWGILRYVKFALPANIIVVKASFRLEWFIKTETMSCKVFDQAIQLFGWRPYLDILEPQMPVFVMPVEVVSSISSTEPPLS